MAAALCAPGQRLEQAVGLEPGKRYAVDVIALPPASSTRVVLEVHPDLAPRPLIETTTTHTDEPRPVRVPEAGVLWEQAATRGRLVVTVQDGTGVVAARLRELTAPPGGP